MCQVTQGVSRFETKSRLPVSREKITSDIRSREPLLRSPEVFLRLVNCAWYAQRVPVRISASFCCLHEEDHRRRRQHSQAEAQGCYESTERVCAETCAGW